MFHNINKILSDITEAKDTTQTSAFKKWFGDSKAVDEQGNPLMVYHGTNKDFNRFDWRFSAQGVHWFSSDKDVILKGESGAASSKILLSCYLRINNMAGWDEYDKYSLQEIKYKGFDGIKLDDNYVVFDANQIKIIDRNPSEIKEHSLADYIVDDSYEAEEAFFKRINPKGNKGKNRASFRYFNDKDVEKYKPKGIKEKLLTKVTADWRAAYKGEYDGYLYMRTQLALNLRN